MDSKSEKKHDKSTKNRNSKETKKNKKDIKYGCLFCDLNKVIALEFNSKGLVIGKSTLLLDEEEDVIDETTLLDEEEVIIKKGDKYMKYWKHIKTHSF